MQVLSYLTVDVFVLAPADDDLLHGDQLAYGVDAADNLFCRIVGAVPSAQRYLHDKAGLLLFLFLPDA